MFDHAHPLTDPRRAEYPTPPAWRNPGRLLADVAAALAGADPRELDAAIDGGLRTLGEALQADRALVWHRRGSGPTIYCWSRTDEPATPDVSLVATIPFIAARLRAGRSVCFRLDEIEDASDRRLLHERRLDNAVVVALPGMDADGTGAALALSVGDARRDWDTDEIEHLRLAAAFFSQALARQLQARSLQAAQEELRRLREANAGADVRCQPRPTTLGGSRMVVSESPTVRSALAQVEQVAATPSTVLLLGETGVGKEVFAHTVHELSARRHRKMIRVSCAAIPSTLIESELFGHERGAFTGAIGRQIGRFEAAHDSTLFLDEIGELSPEVQVKLLRVLQERVIERLGSTQPVKVDVRIVAATNRRLERAVDEGTFREDLFYRLNVFPIEIPPLRERVEDIPALAWHFASEYATALGKPLDSISKDSLRQLQAYQWPGNIRELRNVIERAVILGTSPRLVVPLPQPVMARQPQSTLTLRHLETEHIRATLESTGWRIRGHGGAAQRLGLKPTTLETRMAKLGLSRPRVN